MRRIHNRALIGVTILAAGIVIAVNWASAHRRGEQNTGVTPSQVIRQSAILCRLVAPQDGPDYFSAECDRVLVRGGRPEWTVQCTKAPNETDKRESAFVYCKWDGVTGKLISVARNISAQSRGAREVAPKEAVRRGERWVHEIGMVDRNERMLVMQAPIKSDRAWVIQFRAGQQRGIVRVGLMSDTLQSAMLL